MQLLTLVISWCFLSALESADPELSEAFTAISPLNKDQFDIFHEREDAYQDPSKIIAKNQYLMIAFSGRKQQEGYNCGLETWYMRQGTGNWTPGQCLLTRKPEWIAQRVPQNEGSYISPSFADKNRIYYSVSSELLETDDPKTPRPSCIGMLTAEGEAPQLTWTDDGAAVLCETLRRSECADRRTPAVLHPSVLEDLGNQYLIFGAGLLIAVELDPSSGRIASLNGSEPLFSQLHSHLFLVQPNTSEGGCAEAPFAIRQGDFLYLFVEWRLCCCCNESSSEIRVGRAASVKGPFLGEDDTPMSSGGGRLVLGTEGTVQVDGCTDPSSPALFSFPGRDGARKFLLSYGCRPVQGAAGRAKVLHTRELTWSDGWPEASEAAFNPIDYWLYLETASSAAARATRRSLLLPPPLLLLILALVSWPT